MGRIAIDAGGAGPFYQGTINLADGAGSADLDAVVNAASPGDVLELHLTLGFPWPEWVGPFKTVDMIAAAVGPFVELRGISISGNDLVVVWEA